MSDEEAEQRLSAILAEHNAVLCPSCGHKIGLGDVAWNNRFTEAGTDYCTVEIQCGVCDTEIVHIDSWWPGIEDTEELLDVIDSDWGKYI